MKKLRHCHPMYQYLDVQFVLRGQRVAGQFRDPEPLVLVKELAVNSDLVPRPHVATSSHVLAHHEVIHEAPPVNRHTALPTTRATDRSPTSPNASELVHGQVTIIFVVSVSLSVCLFVCLFVQSFSQPSLIRFRSN